MDVTEKWTRVDPVCVLCNERAAVSINKTWYCMEHCHLGWQSAVRVHAAAAGLDPSEAEADMLNMLHQMGAMPDRYRAMIESLPEGSRQSWNQAICEACWIDTEGEFDGARLVAIRVPIQVPVDSVDGRYLDCCAWCGQPTIMGIYKRADPSTVPYPSWEVPADEQVD